ncbi:ABC transporter ATP-binding protein [archaeon]|nr:ABC transporter ATP-binding protein [archaeon]
MEPVLEIKKVSLSIKHKEILDSINLTINKNEIVGLIGPSGSGKSMLMKSIMDIFKPTEGIVLINGKKLSKKEIGYATQENSIYENLTIQENLSYFGRLFGLKKSEIKKKSKEILPLLELEANKNRLVKHLSGGMKSRVNIACSLIHNPSILLMDEPISGLDPMLRKNILSLVGKIRNQGTTILITSHFISEIEPFCDKIGILSKGKLLDYGSVKELKYKYSKYYNVLITANTNEYQAIYDLLGKKIKISNAVIKNNKLILQIPKTNTINQYLLFIPSALGSLGERISNISITEATLEGVFSSLFKNGDG